MLALALAYNDMKDLFLVDEYVRSRDPGPGLTPSFGQHRGLSQHNTRYLVSVLHELFNLINRERKFFDGPEFEPVRQRMDHPERWRKLVEMASPPDRGTDPLHNALVRIRNNGTFHYNQWKELANAYVAHSDGSTVKQSNAFYSMGKSMEQTRFYYADAAAEGMVNARVQAAGARDLKELVSEGLRLANHGVYTALKAFLELKAGTNVHTTWKGETK